MAQPLYPGCDVWLNNPLRPYEACGTSGMKAALNGGLNLSILDGWWDEWYDGNNGWAIPSADGVDDPDRRDDIEAAALYDLIENEVAPRFYDEDDEGMPGPLDRDGPAHAEVARPQGARRPDGRATTSMQLYSPGGAELADAERRLRRRAASSPTGSSGSASGWPAWRIDHVESSGVTDAPELGDTLEVRAFVSLGDAVARRRRRAGRARPDPARGRPGRHHASRRWRTPRPTRAAGTASRARSRWPRPARSATRCGCCRSNEHLAGGLAELGPGRAGRPTR